MQRQHHPAGEDGHAHQEAQHQRPPQGGTGEDTAVAGVGEQHPPTVTACTDSGQTVFAPVTPGSSPLLASRAVRAASSGPDAAPVAGGARLASRDDLPPGRAASTGSRPARTGHLRAVDAGPHDGAGRLHPLLRPPAVAGGAACLLRRLPGTVAAARDRRVAPAPAARPRGRQPGDGRDLPPPVCRPAGRCRRARHRAPAPHSG